MSTKQRVLFQSGGRSRRNGRKKIRRTIENMGMPFIECGKYTKGYFEENLNIILLTMWTRRELPVSF